ncbi:MAG TPA: hypothetical protein VD772_11510 [Anseongella sp.]|nr:hypothetical protein [Anseongella sp.]
MTNSSDERTSEADYNEILSKLEALLRRHQGKSSSVAVKGDDSPSFHIPSPGTLRHEQLIAADNIPTLTEIVHLAPAMLSPQSDVTSLLRQVLDSALRDAGVELDAAAREALVQALETRLFGI